MNLKLLEFELMEDMRSFDATPIAPLGTKIPMHLKPI
jgi:hypothetical protein